MKHSYCIIIIFVVLLTASEQYEICDSNPLYLRNYTLNITRLEIGSHNIIINMENDMNTTLKTAIIKDYSRHHSIVLFSDDLILNVATKEKLRQYLKMHFNIILIIKDLDCNIFFNPLLQYISKSKWSLFYIILTIDADEYRCNEGVFNARFHTIVEDYLNRLWHTYKIIYVVMAFPFICADQYAIYHGTKQSDLELYHREIRIVYAENYEDLVKDKNEVVKTLMRGYPLKANIFYRFPTSITECTNIQYYINKSNFVGGFCGLDGLVMNDFVEYFQFNVSLPKLVDTGDRFGYVTSSGTITGSLGSIVRGEIDVSFNSRFLVPYLTRGFKFVHYVSRDSLCALVKRPDDVPLWHYPYNAYDVNLWFLIIMALTCIGILTWLSALLHQRITKEPPYKFYVYVLDSINSGIFGYLLMKDTKFKLLRGSCLICSIVFLATYQGHVNYIFTTLVRYDKINTLSELYETGAIIYTSPAIKELLLSPINEVEAKLMDRIQFWPPGNKSAFYFVLGHPNTATLQRKSDVVLETLKSYTDEIGKPMLYSVDQCFIKYYLSYIVRDAFPFIDMFKIFMERLNAAGLPDIYYKWTRRSLSLADPMTDTKSEPRSTTVITLQEQCIAFSLLITGYIVSFIIFIGEKWWFRKHTRI